VEAPDELRNDPEVLEMAIKTISVVQGVPRTPFIIFLRSPKTIFLNIFPTCDYLGI